LNVGLFYTKSLSQNFDQMLMGEMRGNNPGWGDILWGDFFHEVRYFFMGNIYGGKRLDPLLKMLFQGGLFGV